MIFEKYLLEEAIISRKMGVNETFEPVVLPKKSVLIH